MLPFKQKRTFQTEEMMIVEYAFVIYKKSSIACIINQKIHSKKSKGFAHLSIDFLNSSSKVYIAYNLT